MLGWRGSGRSKVVQSAAAPSALMRLTTHRPSPRSGVNGASTGIGGGSCGRTGKGDACDGREAPSGADAVGAREYHHVSNRSTTGPPPWSRTHSTVRTRYDASPG